MVGLRKQGEIIRQFILDHVEQHSADIVTFTSNALGISRQAVNKHIQRLVAQGALASEGTTRNRRYTLNPIATKELTYPLEGLREDVVWRNDISSVLADLPENVRSIWHYGLTEILNNAIDHSGGSTVTVQVIKKAVESQIIILDDGEGIFGKIQKALNLDDERHAVLELAKGKLTTDPAHHTGEGIFFSSRMFDYFSIYSGNTFFAHKYGAEFDWIAEEARFKSGTVVAMTQSNTTARTAKEIFDIFTSGDNYGFTKTMVPVRLAEYGDDKLISRSQAKRLLGRFDRFEAVILDFTSVESIGQAFADEVFRVFANEHPNTTIVEKNAGPSVQRMINRTRHQV